MSLTPPLQSFDTEKGAVYNVTFGLAANPEHPGTDIVHVSVGDFKKAITSPKSAYYKDVKKPYPTKWADVTFAFKATESRSTIRFDAPYATKRDHKGPCIDNVRIVKGEARLKDPRRLRRFESTDVSGTKHLWLA